MKKQSLPILVSPPPLSVPRLIVTNSRKTLRSPISSRVGSPTTARSARRPRRNSGVSPGISQAAIRFHSALVAESVNKPLFRLSFTARGAALCLAEDDELTTPMVATAGFGYLRLRRSGYATEDLRAWVERLLAQRWDEALVYFKHEDEARGPAYALRFRTLLGP